MTHRAGGLRLPHLVRSGREQMDLDHSLLLWAASGPDRFAARTYGWARPTLSLGRAEPFPGGFDEAALEAAGIDVARRPTGGDAVLHDEEVTFAVAASIPGPWRLRPRGFVTRVAESLADALRSLGLDAGVVPHAEWRVPAETGSRDAPLPPGARPCFARAAAGEVQVAGMKTAGIASRFTRGAALCHASVPLTARHRDVAAFRRDPAPALAEIRLHARSVGEALGRAPDPAAMEARILQALEERFGVRLEEGAP